MTPLWTFNEVLAALGGPSAVGRLTGNPPSAVCNWRRARGRYPSKYYFLMRSALEDKGYYAPLDLWGFVGDFKKSA